MSTPYSDRMTSGYQPRARVDLTLLRDLLALLLLLLGVAGLCWAAFAFDWRLGLATLSTALLTTGAFLGYDR